MSAVQECALCKSHSTVELHSIYRGQPIEFGTSWITGSRCYHAGVRQAPTLARIKQIITEQECAA